MSATPDDDARVEMLTSQDYETPGDALAAITETTAVINTAIADEQKRSPETFLGFGGDFGDKLRKWLDKLEQLVKRIAKAFGALNYSISVQWPWGAGVTIGWAPS
jgi:hypothetical protein